LHRCLRGIVHTGVAVRKGMKIGDVDPRATREHCFTISDKALAIAGGVLEAVLWWLDARGLSAGPRSTAAARSRAPRPRLAILRAWR